MTVPQGLRPGGDGGLDVADLGTPRLRPRPGPSHTVVTVGCREVLALLFSLPEEGTEPLP